MRFAVVAAVAPLSLTRLSNSCMEALYSRDWDGDAEADGVKIGELLHFITSCLMDQSSSCLKLIYHGYWRTPRRHLG